MIKNKRILITGGAGFIGSALCARLIGRNHIAVYDNLLRDSLKNKPVRNHPNLELIVGDIRDCDGVQKAMRGANIVVHCAAIAGVNAVLGLPSDTMEVNLFGSVNVLKAARGVRGLEKLVCFSTGEIFGSMAFLVSETDAITFTGAARWVYAVSKLAVEHLAMAYYREEGLPVTIVRPFNIYGPGQTGGGAIREFVTHALEGKPLEIHGDGTQIRAWCYIDDCVDALMLILENPEVPGETFNVGNRGTGITIDGLAKMVVRVLRSDSPILLSSARETDIAIRVPDTRKMRALGFRAKVGLAEGIRRTAQYYRVGG